MNRHEKLVQSVLREGSDANIRFSDLRVLMVYLGFEERIRGSHHIYLKAGIPEKVDMQRDGGHAKPYQARQIRHFILKYRLGAEE